MLSACLRNESDHRVLVQSNTFATKKIRATFHCFRISWTELLLSISIWKHLQHKLKWGFCDISQFLVRVQQPSAEPGSKFEKTEIYVQQTRFFLEAIFHFSSFSVHTKRRGVQQYGINAIWTCINSTSGIDNST